VWGSSFILMKRGLEAFTSEQVAALRIVIAFLFLFPLLVKHYKVNLKKNWKGLIIMGVFGNLIPAFLFTKAETGISSALAGMLNALTPIFAILVGMIFFKTSTSRNQIIGVVIGLLGALLLVSFDKSNSQSSNNNWFALMVAGATLCYAISVNGIKRYLSEVNSITASVWSFTIIGSITLVFPILQNLIFGKPDELNLWEDVFYRLRVNPLAWESLGFVCILAIVGSAISVILFNVLIKKSTAIFASSCTYLIPVVAVMWGTLDGEKVVVFQLLAILIILSGIWLINKKNLSKEVSSQKEEILS
jgi:drug/metabolite transporter (DMT)-like permease